MTIKEAKDNLVQLEAQRNNACNNVWLSANQLCNSVEQELCQKQTKSGIRTFLPLTLSALGLMIMKVAIGIGIYLLLGGIIWCVVWTIHRKKAILSNASNLRDQIAEQRQNISNLAHLIK